MVAELPRPNDDDAAITVVDAVLELPSTQVQLGQTAVRRAPEYAARWNALQGLRDLDQNLEGFRPQVGRCVDILCEVNRVRHTKYFAMSGLSRNRPGSVVFAFVRDLGAARSERPARLWEWDFSLRRARPRL
jgi:hypothetical protein